MTNMGQDSRSGRGASAFNVALMARLRQVRAMTHLSQRDFARKLGVAPSTYPKYETRTRLPQNLIAPAALIAGVSVEYLLCETDDPSIDAADLVPETVQERQLLSQYRGLSERQREAVLGTVDAMAPADTVSVVPAISVTDSDGVLIYSGPERRDPDAPPHTGHERRRRKVLADD